jgi:hypothetical protein
MNTTRTDCHRPSAIVPSDYIYVCCEYTHENHGYDLSVLRHERDAFKAHKHSTNGQLLHEEGSPCDVCGSPTLKYAMLFYHNPSNVYVRVGEDCAYKLGLGGSAQFNAFKRQLKEQAEVYAGKAKAQRILAEAGFSAAWAIAMSTVSGWEENTIRDIVSKLIRYGSVSEKALAFVGRLIEKIGERAAKEAARAAENEAAADFPVTSDRIEIVGTVLTTKIQESQFGSVLKMLVRSEAGWKVWITCPGNPNKGDTVKFFAKMQPSPTDSKFGFGSRPTKFEIVKEAAALEAAPRDEVNVPDVQTQGDNYFA